MKRTLYLLSFLLLTSSAWAQAIRQNDGFRSNVVPRNDDGSSALQDLGFTINFFGRIRSHAYVNNNGNLTFDAALATFTPFGLERTRREIIAAFFGDVDTRPQGSALVTFGRDVINGHAAFGANYINVGYFANHTDKLNSFQIVLIDRSDTGFGNFDIEFNYERIAWETGDASGGSNGFGGTPASAGWSNGTGEPGTSFEIDGSLVSGAFLDGGSQSLARNRLNSTVRGRFLFRARDGRIQPPLSVLTGCPLPTAELGNPYAFQFLAAGTGTNTRWDWLADPGTPLPAGLNLGQNGVVSGAPTASGTTEFTVRLTTTLEDGEQTLSRRCAITVAAPRLAVISACPLPAATVGQPYSRTFQVAGGRGPFTWSLGEGSQPLPPGLALSAAGTLSGLPTAEGSYFFQVRVDAGSADAGEPATKSCALTVNPATLNLTSSCSLPNATLGVPYSQLLTVSGGADPFRWTALESLPAGLSLTPEGRIVGSPLQLGSSSFSVAVTDSRSTQLTQSCRLTVDAPALDVTTACPLPPATTGEPYSQSLAVSGGAGPYTWSALSGLPNGLSLSADGTLSGIPGAAGPFGFRFLVVDASGRAAVKGCTLSILRSSFGLTSCPLPRATAGVAYSQFLSAGGGFGPYVFSAVSALPSGLQLTTAGNLHGTPSQPGVFPVQVRVLDRSGRSAINACDLTVAPSPLEITGECPAPDARVGTPYNVRFGAAGGSEPYRFSAFSALPSGLTLSPGGVLSGTPNRVTSELQFGLRVADAENRMATRVCSVRVRLPDLPVIQVSQVPASLNAASAGPSAGIEISSPYSLPLHGTLALSVEPVTGSSNAQVNQPDPRVRFTNGQRTVNFTLLPGQQRVSFPIASTGTVASNITVSVIELRAGGVPVPVLPAPRIFSVRPAAPVVTDACFRTDGAAFNAVVTGYTTTRELRRAEVSLTPDRGSAATFAVDVRNSALDYFSTDESIRSGGAFMLTIPFETIGGVVNEASITLSNSQGASASRTMNRCQ